MIWITTCHITVVILESCPGVQTVKFKSPSIFCSANTTLPSIATQMSALFQLHGSFVMGTDYR